MLVFIVSGEHQYTIRDILETRGADFYGSIMIFSYRDFLTFRKLPLADYIFLDAERVSECVRAAAGRRLSQLQQVEPGFSVLNAPQSRLGRLSIANRLHAAGINRYRVMPVNAIADDLRFPVFVRRLDDHLGPVTGLLEDRAALNSALRKIMSRDATDASLAVTEYVDTRDEEGRHQKLSYFRIGNALFPGAYNVGPDWVCKGVAGDDEPPEIREQRLRFLRGNPHEAIMRQVFEAARVTYGRADYVMIDGLPQIFEINTNPMVVPPSRMPPGKRIYVEEVERRWFQALRQYSAPSNKRPHWIAVPTVGEVALPEPAGHIGRRIVHRVLTATDQLHRETALMRPLRALRIAR